MSPADFQSVTQVIEGVAPDEIYNLSGQSSVSLSFTQPAETLAGIAARHPQLARDAAASSGDSPLLQRRFFRVLWQYRNARGERTDGVPAEEPLRRGQGGSHFVVDQLPWVLRTLRLFGTSLQSRIAPSAEPLCNAQSHRGSGQDRCGQPRAACSRQPLDPPRLGLGSRLRRGDVENASVRSTRRLRCCFGRRPLARGIHSEGVCRGRAQLARSR
jgi:hypothetical protein